MKNGRVAVVTGGGQGIGRGVTEYLLRKGWRVAMVEHDREAGMEAARALGRRAEFILADVSSERSVKAMAAEIRKRHRRLDALINNAGVNYSGSLAETTLENWNRVIGINLTGAFLCARELAPLLAASRGSIVNIASTRALMSEADTAPYSASKGGLVALTHSLAVSLGPRVRVNCISPGWIEVSEWKKKSLRKKAKLRDVDHAQHPAGRVGTPDDVAAAVGYLCSQEAGFVTGANLVIDGGMSRKMIYAE